MEEKKQEDESYLDVKEAASLMRCSSMQVYRDCAQGAIPHIRKGNRIIFKRRDLIAWLDSLRIGPVIPDVRENPGAS